MKGGTGGAFVLRSIFYYGPNPMPLRLRNVMFPRKAAPTKVRPVAFESCTPPHSCVYLQSTEGMLAGERHNLSITNVQMLHTMLWVLAYRYQASPTRNPTFLGSRKKN